jgi:pyruvate dehydrogenase E1 component beta subunit
MFGGQARPAVVIRMPHGIWRNSAAQHSQTLESWFTHIPGLVVAVPSTPADVAGLLVSAIRSDDPVLFFDPKNLFPLEGEVAEVIEPIPFGQARRARQGGDLTIVTWSAIVPQVEEAAAMLAARGIAADVLDLRTLWPWDEEAVVESVRRTGRLLVVHEAVTTGGFGAEVLSRTVERLGMSGLKAAARLGQPRVPVPFAPPLEDALKVDTAKIVAAAEAVIGR